MSKHKTKDKPAPALDVDELLDAAAKVPGRKASSLAFNGELAGETAAKWLDVNSKIQELERERGTLRDQLIAAVTSWHEETCMAKGEYNPTVEIKTDAGVVRVSFPHRYGKIPAAKEEQLRELLGDDFDNLFFRLRSLQVRPAVAGDRDQLEQLVTTLVKAMGKDAFTKCFEAEIVLKPTPRFTHTKAEMPATLRTQLEQAGVTQTISVAAA